MKIQSILTLAATAALNTSASASVSIDYVSVGHAGNAADPATGSLYGAVAYAYQIGKYEVTNAQYGAFLNAADPDGANANGIYNANMGSELRGGITYAAGAVSGAKYTLRTSMGDKPVNYVSWYDAARFANWMMNGQGSGSTETGAYTLSGNTGIITKNLGAIVYIPTEDEWYKAAYYSGSSYGNSYDNPYGSSYGTFDQGNNVSEWNDAVIWGDVRRVEVELSGGNVFEANDAVISGSSRGLRGVAWHYLNGSYLRASYRAFDVPTAESSGIGFRVASVPEPTSIVLTMLASGVMLARRKR